MMVNTKKRITFLLCLLLCAVLLPVIAFADTDGPVSFPDDSANELLFDPNPKQAYSRLMSPADSPLTEKTLSCAGFITTEAQQEYIDRMIQWYLDAYPALRNTLASGSSVVMFFEGGSDNTQNIAYADPDYRDGALGLVLRQEGDTAYIADYCENCSTMPDFPLDTEYDNGHSDYGTAILMDGVYNVANVNHRGYYFALNVTAAGCSNAPCVYMRSDGTFARLNGTGINVHTRMRDHVGDSVLSPVSAGCLTVGDNSSLDEYNRFMSAFNADRIPLIPAEFDGADTYQYDGSNFQPFGMIVVDRYLAREKMLEIYGDNQEAVDVITLHSCLAQQDPEHILSGFTAYPSYLALTLSDSTVIKSLPTDSAADLSAATAATATSLYAAGSDLWYRVQTDSGIGFLPASSVVSVTTLYDDISTHNFNYPTEKPQFRSFSVSGILGSVYNRFTSVTGSISASGVIDCTYTAPVNSHSYSINASDYGEYNMDYNLAFGGLSLGLHRYRVTGTVRNYYADGDWVTYEEQVLTFVDRLFTVVPLAVLQSGTDTCWPQNSETGLTVHCNANASWVSGILLDDIVVPDTEYSKTGDVFITLAPTYLQTLQKGPHTLTIQTTKGVTLQHEFTVECPHLHTETRDAVSAELFHFGYTGNTYCTDCGQFLHVGLIIPSHGAKLLFQSSLCYLLLRQINLLLRYLPL